MPRPLRSRRILIGLTIAGTVVVALGAGARTLLPPWLRGAVERAASREVGREVRIAGRFEPSFSLTPRLVAGDVTLANAPWGSEAAMVRAGRVTFVLDLASLWSGPLRVRELEIADVRVLLEADREGRGNWVFPPAPATSKSRERSGTPRLELARARIRGLEVVYRRHPDAAAVALEIEQLEARFDPDSRMLEIRGGGRFAEAPWEIAGRLGTLENLRAGHDIEQALAGRVGETRIEVRGRIRDPLSLGGPDLDVRVAGPDVAAALAPFGLRSAATGPFRLRGRFTPAADGVGVDVQGDVGGVTVAARGLVSALTSLDRLDARVEAAGADASEVGSWIGVEGLPPRPFEVSARLRRAAGQLSLDDARFRVGATSLLASGRLGEPPRFVGTDLVGRATGRDLSELDALTGLRLPAGPFEVAGRFLRHADGLALEAVELRFHDSRIRAAGNLGEPPRWPDLALAVEASGPDLGSLAKLAGVDLPPRPFAVRGRIARDGSALLLDAVEGRLGDDTVSGSGRLVPARRLVGTDVRVRIAGPDFGRLASLAGLDGGPAEPFDLEGRVRFGPDGYSLAGVEGSVSRIAVAGEGHIGAPFARDGTELTGRIHGPAFSDLAAWGLPEGLPGEAFSIAGGIEIADAVYRADDIVATVGAHRASLDGVLGALPDLSLLDVALEASGPSLADLGRFLPAAPAAATGRLPARAYAASGRVRGQASGYELDEVRVRVGATTVRVDGALTAGGGLVGGDLRFAAAAPDASLLTEISGLALPGGPFEAHGQVARIASGLSSAGVVVTLGEARAEVSGTLGAGPDLEGTDLRIDASGPDLRATLGPPAGLANLPAERFELSAEIAGGAGRLASQRFAARLGDNDLSGRLSMRLDGTPSVDADLRSRRLDVTALAAGFGPGPAAPAASGAAAAAPPGARERVISDEPLTSFPLRKLDATLRLEAAELVLPGLSLRDVVVAGGLEDGALRVDRFEGSGIHGGRARASFAIEPLGDGYRLRTEGRLEGGRLVVSKAQQAPGRAPSLDLEFDLAGEGRSLHEIAASSTGQVLVVVGSGEIPSTLGERMESGVMRNLLDALTPFRKTSDRAELECGIAWVVVTGGKAAVEPIAVRTDKVTVTGHGRIDFDTEAIDLAWTLKQRKGLGLSAGQIANSFVKLGGTLASPSLDLKPLEAATSMGAAVATAGLTALSRGIWDRITAEKKVCVDALAKARRQAAAPRTPPGP